MLKGMVIHRIAGLFRLPVRYYQTLPFVGRQNVQQNVYMGMAKYYNKTAFCSLERKLK